MKKLIIFAGVVLVVTGGFAWWYGKLMTPPEMPVALTNIEQALGDNVVALGYVNVAYARQLEGQLLGSGDKGALEDVVSETDGTLFQTLNDAGVDFKNGLDQVLAALILQDDNPGYFVAMIGRFQTENIQQQLAKHYKVVEQQQHGVKYLELSTFDRKRCEYLPAMALSWDEHALYYASPHLIADLVHVIHSPEPNSGFAQVAQWQHYRSANLASAALFSPDKANKGLTGITRMIAAQVSEKAMPLESLYVGASVSALPPKLSINGLLAHNDEQWASQVNANFSAWYTKTSGTINQEFPLLSRLFGSISLNMEPSRLKFSASVDKQDLENFKQIPEQLLSLVFTPSAKSADQATQTTEKIIPEKDIRRYQASVSTSSLPSFTAQDNEQLSHAVVSGPFAAYIKSLRLNRDDQLELTVAAVSEQIPNVSMPNFAERSLATLHIREVKGANGSLLAEQTCGKELNTDGAKFTMANRFVKNQVVETGKVEKKLLLKSNVTSKEIESISGDIELYFPVQTKTVRVKADKTNNIYDDGKVRIKISSITGDAVNYELSGDMQRLLESRGLNSKGQYLSSAGGFSMQRIFGSGKSGAWQYKGQPHEVELVVATDLKRINYPFTINSLEMDYAKSYGFNQQSVALSNKQEFNAHKTQLPKVEQCNERDYAASSKDHPAILMCLDQEFQRWGRSQYYGTLRIHAPKLASLQNNMSAIVLTIDSVKIEDTDNKQSKTIDINEPHFLSFNQGSDSLYATKQLGVKLPKDIDAHHSKLVSFQGKLNINLVKEIDKAVIPLDTIGRKVESSADIVFQYEGFEGEKFFVRVNGNPQRVVNVYYLDDAGQPLQALFPRIDHREDGDEESILILESQVRGKPVSMVVEIAKSLDKLVYTFDRENNKL